MQRIEEALEIDPAYTRPYRLRGRIYREQEDYELAAADYVAYLESRDGRRDIAAYSELAWVYGQLGDLDGAKQANERALDLSMRLEGVPDLTTLGNLAILARDMNDRETACRYVTDGLEYSSTDATLNALNESMGCGIIVPEPGAPQPAAP